jgi:hypothetical protein
VSKDGSGMLFGFFILQFTVQEPDICEEKYKKAFMP